jgi:hypothetical protein
LLSVGEATMAERDLDGADTLFRQGLAMAETLSLRAQQGRALEGQAHVLLAKGDNARAAATWQRAAELHYANTVGAQSVVEHLAALPGYGACPQCTSASVQPTPLMIMADNGAPKRTYEAGFVENDTVGAGVPRPNGSSTGMTTSP